MPWTWAPLCWRFSGLVTNQSHVEYLPISPSRQFPKIPDERYSGFSRVPRLCKPCLTRVSLPEMPWNERACLLS